MKWRHLGVMSVLMILAGCASANSDIEACAETDSRCCSPMATRCTADGQAVQICTNEAWVIKENCSGEKTCNATSKTCEGSTVVKNCTDGDIKCDTDGSRVLECVDGDWSAKVTCDAQKNETCDESSKTCRSDCNTGDAKCSDDLKSTLVCKQGTWELDKACDSDHYCNTAKADCVSNPVCTDNTYSCSSDRTQVLGCKDGQYFTNKTCMSSEVCVNGSCIPACTESVCRNNNAVRCIESLEVVESCGAKTCIQRDGNVGCEDYVCSIGDNNGCTSDGKKMVCQNNAWTNVECQNNTVCNRGNCVAKICDENEKRCKDNKVQKCVNNEWVTESTCDATQMCHASDYTCVNVVCDDGDLRCLNNNVQKCTSNAFQNETLCNNDTQICQQSGTTASCVTKTCQDDNYQCSDNKLQQCQRNLWVDIQNCDSDHVCNANTKTCVNKKCDEGELKCSTSSKSLMVCENNDWKTQEACYENDQWCYADGNSFACKTKVCDDGYVCDNNVLKFCSNNAFVGNSQDCLSDSCNAKTGTCDKIPECTSETRKCVNNNLYTCGSDGFYPSTPSKTCTGKEVCDATNGVCIDTSECEDGKYYCHADTTSLILKNCVDGQWTDSEKCDPALETCNATTKACELKPVCDEGEYSCNGLVLRSCDKGQWKTEKTCTTSQTCDESAKKCMNCSTGADQCDDNKYQVCENGDWVTKQTCGTGQTCSVEHEKCIECSQNGAFQCDGQNLYVCNGNQWKSSMQCGTDSTCDASKGTCVLNAVCSSNEYLCSGQVLKDCRDGQWQTKETCGDLYTCNSSTGTCDLTPVCTPNDVKCDENTYSVCKSDGQWESESCGDNRLCVLESKTAGSCVDKMTLPSWCSLHGVNDTTDQGFGRLLMPSGVSTDEISGDFLCGDISTPVATWGYSADAIVGTNCSGCGNNVEFASYSLKAPAGTYQCTFAFEFGPQTIVCKSGNGGTPIVLDSNTMLERSDTTSVTIPSASTDEITWCWLKHLDENSGKAYGRIYLPASTTPASVSAMLICGDKSVAASTWNIRRSGVQNINCSDCANNIEFMTDALVGDGNTLASGRYDCAFRFDVNGKSYICSTNESKGLIKLESGTMLYDAETDGNIVTVWGYTAK